MGVLVTLVTPWFGERAPAEGWVSVFASGTVLPERRDEPAHALPGHQLKRTESQDAAFKQLSLDLL